MTPDNPNPGSILPAPASGVTVRMYNPGFGDCLLLAFRSADGSPRYLLIDCGAHHRYPNREILLNKVAQNIADATGSHLHVVAGTHQHTDHLDGFRLAAQVFDQIQIDDLWLAWTEDPNDATANELRDHYDKQIKALFGVVNQLRAAGHAGADPLSSVLEFEYSGALGATSSTPPIPYLKARALHKPVRSEDYLHPGQKPLTLPDVPGVKIYVFGPPVNATMLKVLEKNNELYPEMKDVSEGAAFATAVMAADGGQTLSDDEKDAIQRSHPFDSSSEIPISDLNQRPDVLPFFNEHYGFSGQSATAPNWRRIDTDWLGAGENLALSINSYTNNTSLVLAVELTSSPQRKVLIFAADAQTGNWLSWQPLSWPGEGPGGTEVTAKDLLARTVLYKVGHHGSRNATLSLNGLEEMVSQDLVAMIPVDEKWAHDAMNWEHPAQKVLERLEQKTSGRVIRTDRIPLGSQLPPQPEGLHPDEWQSFISNLKWDPDHLWIQFTVLE